MSRPLMITFSPPSHAPSAPAKHVLLAPLVPTPAVVAPFAVRSEPVIEAWAHTLQCWDDAKRHDTVLGLAAKHEQLAWLAGCYRAVARERPDDPIAPARLARVLRAALVTMLADRPPEAKTRMPYRGAVVLLVVAVLAMLGGLWLLDFQSHGVHQTSSARVKPTAASR